MNAARPAFLKEPSLKLVLFGGKGGVGKTTCACAAALELASAQADRLFLLVSTDPAHSIVSALAGMALPDNLTVRELDAAAALRDFKSRHEQALMEIAERGTFFDKEDLHGLMDLSLPGMDEVAAYLELAEALRQGRYHCIILDTAPTGHTLRLLEMPELVRRWLLALDSLLAKHRYIRRHYTGDASLDHLDRFLLDMDNAVKTMQTLLRDASQCRFVPVMLAESMSVEESADLARALAHRHIAMPELVVNQMLPANDCPSCQAERRRQALALVKARERLPNPAFWTLPLLPRDPSGDDLKALWAHVSPLTDGAAVPPPPKALPLRVESPAKLPASTLRLLIFAGKGGVGKTTMACATALALRERHPALRILLFSTDPAHSLSDALGVPVGAAPTAVLPGLDAQEINAEAAFEDVRRAYQAELEAFLASAFPNLDITFDREVMEHLLDMAPPGLDEIMALTAVMEHLERGCYDLVVMDSSPSGHLIRLMDLPTLIGDWLKLFFSLLLKYRRVMRLPHLSERLVKLSQEIKSLRKLLADPKRAALCAVTIPTRLALDKTLEMAENLHRIDINLNSIFINQITPTNDCALCAAINLREMAQIKQADTLFPKQPKTLIYRQADPGGLAGLSQLGANLYRAT
ncbi:MAG: ArsA family ATPase [Candidatus Methylumidiphilus sp.]